MQFTRYARSHRWGVCLLGAAVIAIAGISAHAQERFPSRPIEVIVPWGTGGGADFLGRLAAKWFEQEFKSPFPVINVPGATGAIGIGRMLQAGSEAHAIAVLTGDTLGLAAFPDSQFKLSDITALGIMIRQPSGMFSRGEGSFKSWNDVITTAKAKPGTLTVAITGANSPDEATVNHLGSKGVQMVNVAYARPGERYTAVLGGHVDLLYEQAGDIKGMLDSKSLRPLLFFATRRLPPPFSDVPVSAEFGYEVLLPQMRAIVASARADSARLTVLSNALDHFVATPEYSAYLRDQYALPDSYIARKDAQRFLEGELDSFQKMLNAK